MKPIYLSSSLTVLYKLIFPLFLGFITLLIWVAAIALHGEPDAEALIVIGAVFTVFMIFLIPSFLLKRVYYDETHLYVNNFRSTKTIPLNRIKYISKYIFYFFKVEYLNEQGQKEKALFLPHLLERFEAMMGTPESVEIFEEKVLKPVTGAKI